MERFLRFVRMSPSGCWEWTGARQREGYGRFGYRGAVRFAHRIALVLFGKTIPDGAVVDHLCRNTSCVNPDHLEPVTNGENVRRGALPDLIGRRNGTKTRCPQGHAYSPENTVVRNGSRHCRLCQTARTAARSAARAAARQKVELRPLPAAKSVAGSHPSGPATDLDFPLHEKASV
ncbi:HNH endonuclease [Sphingomonas cannabina]|uniref:HNH endonuclease signature motif containing protein n=1 Tax=Sphingomonas cannabina TaxID=2899123 RepID=UPI001F1BFA29|nr:HNH endonuclease signature motif containing protein [Sphingomonas cannabina]UIJ43701.1 HNH endonuclease [Sphingomonas cannabina]